MNQTRMDQRRAQWKPGPEAYICNFHYDGFKGPTRADPSIVPTLFKRPHDFYSQSAKKPHRLLDRFQDNSDDCEPPAQDTSKPTLEQLGAKCLEYQNEIEGLKKHVQDLKAELAFLKTKPQRLDVALLKNDELIMYTGLNCALFDILLGWLHPAIHVHRDLASPVSLPVSPTGRFLSDSQKLLLVLMRLRQNLTQEDLAFRFDVEQSTVSRVINQWIPLLAHHLRGLIKWPKTTIGPTDTPYNHMPNTVGIIDGTEIFIQRPSNLATQKSSYSDYKSHTTVKYLVAIDPFTGVFTFVSPGFSGNSSDRFVVESSSFLDLLQPGQRILADRGFTARDLIAKKRAFLTIPSFLRGTSQLTGQQAMETRTIASVRIRVENAIKRMKDFRLLSDTQPNRINKQILDDMVIVACALCNLQPPLIVL